MVAISRGPSIGLHSLCVAADRAGLRERSTARGCDSRSQRMPRDPPGTARNASPAHCRGNTSTGAYGIVRLVTIGENRFTFQETWFRIDSYSQPKVWWCGPVS